MRPPNVRPYAIHPAITVVRLRGHFWSRLIRNLLGVDT